MSLNQKDDHGDFQFMWDLLDELERYRARAKSAKADYQLDVEFYVSYCEDFYKFFSEQYLKAKKPWTQSLMKETVALFKGRLQEARQIEADFKKKK